MDFDLSIKQIDSVWYLSTKKWKREFFAPRIKDGIVLVLDGVNKYTFQAEDVVAKANDIIILPGNIPYSGISLSNGVFESIVIDFDCFEGETLSKLNFPRVISVEDKKYYKMLFKEILQVWENKCADTNLHMKSLMYKLIYKLFSEVNAGSNEKIPQILEYINTNLSNKFLSVKGLCDKFYISESTLMRGIRKITGYTPNEYICLQRVEKAREYILIGEKSIKEISVLCGFSSPYYFSNVFKKKYGYSPKNYRALLDENNGGNKFN